MQLLVRHRRLTTEYSFVTGHEFDKIWKDSKAFREKLEAFYGEVNQ